MAMWVLLLSSLFTLSSCSSIPEITILAEQSKTVNGVLYYQEIPFSGYVKSENRLKTVTKYSNGKRHGLEKKYYQNDSIFSIRSYLNGEKDGVHLGFWQSGNKKFSYSFNNGIPDGQHLEWYKDGSILREQNYIDGEEIGAQKMWRQNGKLAVNYVVKNGRKYGVVKSRLCFSVKDGRGKFTQ